MQRVLSIGRDLSFQSHTTDNAPRRRRRTKWMARGVAPLAAAVALWAQSSLAAIQTWDANPANPTVPNDGTGNWNTNTDANWSNGAIDAFWTNGNVAIIGNNGTPGTITINDSGGT